MYQVLLYIHIVCAIIWVGGAFYTQLLAIRVGRSDDPSDLPKLGRHIAFLGMRVFLPASILLFVAGLVMVAQQWSFGQLWVSVAMALWIVSALTGALYLGPRTEKIAALFEAEGPASTAGRALLARVFLVARLELVSFAVVLALMVFKPGAAAA
ncbi:MAG: DUF2269 family protein [Candidatus Limnocylindrales bacterium]